VLQESGASEARLTGRWRGRRALGGGIAFAARKASRGGVLSRCCAVELWLSRRRQALPSLGACRVAASVGLGLYVSSGRVERCEGCTPCRLPNHGHSKVR